MGKRRQQPGSSRAKRLRTSRSESSESEPLENPQPDEGRELAPVRDRDNRSSDSLSAVEQLTNVMREVFSTLGDQRPSTSTGFRGDAVPYFDPEDEAQDIVTWCRKIDELREVFNWSEEATIYYALAKLRGLAQTWYRSLKSVNQSWAEWKEKLKRAFPSTKDYAERLEEMMKRKKSPGETYIRYYFEKLALINNCGNIFGSDAVTCIIHGLQDDHVKTSARSGNYSEPEALFTYLRTVKNVQSPAKRDGTNKKSFIDKSKSDGTQSSQIKCYVCGKRGHKSFYCRERTRANTNTRLVCTYCHKQGHEESRCFIKQNKIPNQSKEATL